MRQRFETVEFHVPRGEEGLARVSHPHHFREEGMWKALQLAQACAARNLCYMFMVITIAMGSDPSS
jgi:hypothetical protein